MRWAMLLLLLAGCMSQERCLRQFPIAEREVTVRDTVIFTPPARLDTVWNSLPQDTLIVEKERVTVRIERRRDTLRVAADCRPDTVRVPRIREIIRYVPVAAKPHWRLPGWAWAVVSAVGVGLLARLLR